MILSGFSGFSRRAAVTAGTALALALVQPIMVAPAEARDAPTSFADLVEVLMPTVVNITTTQNVPQQGPRLRDLPQLPPGSPFEELFKEFFDRKGGEEQKRRGTSLGSGFIVDPEGYIITNNHVIQGAEDITVILRDDTQLKAKLIGSDSRVDIAVLKVEPPNKKPLPAVKFGDSDKSRVGDWVIAIGNPFGLGHSVTAGIISARGRALSDSLDDYLQTDAAINKGNSGGPLFNADGEVIGVNTAIYSPTGTNAGLAFSIPSNLVKQAADQLREFGRIRRGWVGVSYQSVTDDIADSFGLDTRARRAGRQRRGRRPGRQGGHQAQRHHPLLLPARRFPTCAASRASSPMPASAARSMSRCGAAARSRRSSSASASRRSPRSRTPRPRAGPPRSRPSPTRR